MDFTAKFDQLSNVKPFRIKFICISKNKLNKKITLPQIS